MGWTTREIQGTARNTDVTDEILLHVILVCTKIHSRQSILFLTHFDEQKPENSFVLLSKPILLTMLRFFIAIYAQRSETKHRKARNT